MQPPVFFRQPVWIQALPFIGIYAVYVIGFFLDVIDVDSAQYAELSREMLETGSYLQLYERGQDYLDKPPLLFWLTSLCYKLFGVSSVTFRLPSFLFSLLGNYATYRLAKRQYGYETGYLAALMVASCQAFLMFNHDVRMDTMLTGAVIFAIWQINEFLHTGRLVSVVLGCTGIAAAMLTKGPIGLMVPVLAFATDFVLKRQWRNFFRWQWLVGLLWTALLLVPMCIGLYQQFDLHPEKVMYGRSGTSGLRFFFWTQSFGRITGESTWKDDSDIFFFMHTFLWAFLPWSLLCITALFQRLREIGEARFRIPATSEALSVGGFLLPYIALSLSRYQLPHYIFVLLPLAAILTARYVYTFLTAASQTVARIWKGVQAFVAVLLWIVVALVAGVVFPLGADWKWGIAAGFLAGTVYAFMQKEKLYAVVGVSLLAILGVNSMLNTHFYPTLLRYQAGSMIGHYIQDHSIDPQRCYSYRVHPHSLDFYARHVVASVEDHSHILSLPKPCWLVTDQAGMEEISGTLGGHMVQPFVQFHVSMLSLPFLNPATRSQETQTYYLMRID